MFPRVDHEIIHSLYFCLKWLLHGRILLSGWHSFFRTLNSLNCMISCLWLCSMLGPICSNMIHFYIIQRGVLVSLAIPILCIYLSTGDLKYVCHWLEILLLQGHSVTRKLDSDGKVDTMQTLHNLDEGLSCLSSTHTCSFSLLNEWPTSYHFQMSWCILNKLGKANLICDHTVRMIQMNFQVHKSI